MKQIVVINYPLPQFSFKVCTLNKVDLISLHRYYMWANRLQDYFDMSLIKSKKSNESHSPTWFADDSGLFMSHWYAALYVVIEGYQKLDIHDPQIDELLDSPNVDLLRRYRNGTCHFQHTYFDDRFVDFMETEDTPLWVRNLNREFGRFFIETIRRERGAR